MTFSGTVASDFLKLVTVDDNKKSSLINFQSSDFLSIRESLIEYIKAVYPLDYQNFSESDLGMMLLELVAYTGAVNSLKADMLANENFIRTARARDSVKNLLELVGVRMKGPISAAANAKITWNQSPWIDGTIGANIEIPIDKRVISISSPEDGAPLSFTLYKENGGLVQLANSTGSIFLTLGEADNLNGTVYTNLVLLEGSLVREQGTFTSPEAVKTIRLSQAPVIEGSIQVHIQGGLSTSGSYTQVDNIFFASGNTDKIFQVVSNDNFGATVVFGDLNLGLSPKVGDSYFVTYRVGGGTRGNIKKEVLNFPIEGTIVQGTVTVNANGVLENISLATGGSDAESLEHAKRYAPLTFRRQDRLVTLQDFKAFANTFISNYGSVGKATAATRRAYSSANIIDIYVLEKASDFQLRKATPQFKVQMLNAMNQKKMLTDEIIIVDGLIRTIDLSVTLRVDRELRPEEETIKIKARNKILSFFNVDNNDFGRNFIPQDLNRAVFELNEVRYSTVDNIKEVIRLDFNEIIQLNNLSINVVTV